MKQLVQNFRSGALSVEDVPPPALRSGGLLVATEASLVSAGTERSLVELARKNLLQKAIARPDLARRVIDKVRRDGLAAAADAVVRKLDRVSPLGYSAAGRVLQVAPDVTGFRVGQRVACGGAGYANHAEILYVPRNLAVPVPGDLPPDVACYVTVGAIALHAVRNAEPQLGEVVAVIGLGLIGQLVVQLLVAGGCRVVGVDVSQDRLDRAKAAGAEVVAMPGERGLENAVSDLSHGIGADAVIITAATADSEPVRQAAKLARDRGRVVVVGATGLDVPRELYYEKELSLRVSRSCGPGRYDREYEERGLDYPAGYVRWTETRNMRAFLELAAAARIEPGKLTTHRFPLASAVAAYDLLLGKSSEVARPLGIILECQPETVSTVRRLDLREQTTQLKNHDQPRLRASSQYYSPQPAESRLGRFPVLKWLMRYGGAEQRKSVGISMVGAGDFGGGVLIPQLKKLPGVSLRGLCGASGLRAQHMGKRHGFAFCTSDLDELLADAETDAVIVATRHNLHAEYVCRVLRAGRPVFVEKPLAISVEQFAQAAAELLAHPGRTLVGFNRRFAPLALRMRDHFAGCGPLLMHYRVNAGSFDRTSWLNDSLEGGGRVLGEACHFIDLMTFLVAHNPAVVSAAALPARSGSPIEDVQVTIEFKDGSVGHLMYCGRGDRAFSKERVEVFGGGRVGVLDDFRGLTLVAAGRSQRHRSFRQDKGHAGELGAFAAAVASGRPQPIDDRTMLSTSLATLAIPRAIAERRPIALDELWPAVLPDITQAAA